MAKEVTAKDLMKKLQSYVEKDTYHQDKRAVKFGKWDVNIAGDMVYDGGRYSIDCERLDEDNWILHMFSKAWIDWNDFLPAYFQACKNAGVQFVNIKIFYQ